MKLRNYAPSTSTCGGEWLVILSTALNTLVDHSSSSFSSSKNAMLSLLGHLRFGTCCGELGSQVESRLSEITDPEGVPSGVPYIAETGDSVEALEFSLLMLGGGSRVNPVSL
jgi:hypothetical protein